MSASDRRGHKLLILNRSWACGHATKRRFRTLVTASRSRERLIAMVPGLEGKLIIYMCTWGDVFNEDGPSGSRHYHVAYRDEKFTGSVFDTSVPEEIIAEAVERSRVAKGNGHGTEDSGH